ncbi:1097_t:CDS:2, partial [Gigaspora margarita]
TLDLTDQPGFNILALVAEYNWLKENFVMALPTISKLQSCKRIQDCIMKTIEPPINSESDIHDILAIANELALIQLIDRIQDLLIKNEPYYIVDTIEEIDVWKYLVKWTKAQYRDNELKSFKKYLEPFISYIRFCEMAEHLYKSLIAYFLANLKPKNFILQPRNGLINIGSTIIKKKNARIIVGWIEGITAFTKKLFCEFSCIYRATYYGFDSEKFIKELSDSDYFLSKTSSKVLLINIKDSDLTIGGHISSLSRWSSSKNNETSSNFHIPCSDIQYLDKSWVDFHFGNDYLKLFGRNGT